MIEVFYPDMVPFMTFPTWEEFDLYCKMWGCVHHEMGKWIVALSINSESLPVITYYAREVGGAK